jgi:hypothetical protein
MGGAVIEAGGCDGNDVVDELNAVFEHPGSVRYEYAKSHNTFGDIQNVKDNYNDLIKAYGTAGVSVSPRWQEYLSSLGTVHADGPDPGAGPQNIYNIAQMRYKGLIKNKKMKTKLHKPVHGGHVQTQDGSGDEPNLIDSPYPL